MLFFASLQGGEPAKRGAFVGGNAPFVLWQPYS